MRCRERDKLAINNGNHGILLEKNSIVSLIVKQIHLAFKARGKNQNKMKPDTPDMAVSFKSLSSSIFIVHLLFSEDKILKID